MRQDSIYNPEVADGETYLALFDMEHPPIFSTGQF